MFWRSCGCISYEIRGNKTSSDFSVPLMQQYLLAGHRRCDSSFIHDASLANYLLAKLNVQTWMAIMLLKYFQYTLKIAKTTVVLLVLNAILFVIFCFLKPFQPGQQSFMSLPRFSDRLCSDCVLHLHHSFHISPCHPPPEHNIQVNMSV